MNGPTRLTAVSEEPAVLSVDDSRSTARVAYAKARKAQRALVTHLHLTELLYRDGQVSRARLRGELREAQEQVERAQAVRDALAQSIDAMEAGARGLTPPGAIAPDRPGSED